jgi:signal peptidase I
MIPVKGVKRMKWMRRKTSVLGAAVVLAGVASLAPFRFGLICGGSMAPTLHSGQPFLLDREAYRTRPITRGDILVFERDGVNYVKRVAALAGETFFVLRYTDTGWDYPVRPEEVPALRRMLRHEPGFPGRIVQRRVPEGCCYVLGDASNCSEDSRYFGPVPLEDIRGKLLMSQTAAPVALCLAATGGAARM